MVFQVTPLSYPMADPLSKATSMVALEQVISSIISCCYIYQQFAGGARTDIGRLIQEAKTVRHAVENFLCKVTAQDEGSGTVSFPWLATIQEEKSGFGTCLKDLSRLQERLQSPVEKWRKSGACLLWPLHESEIEGEAERMHRMKSFITFALPVYTAPSIWPVQRNTRELRKRILEIDRGVKLPDDQRLQVMLEWLGAPDPSLHHNRVRKGRVNGTGTWLLDGPEFEKWRDSTEMAVLGMHGIPGCGKSVLASSVIDSIRHHSPNDGHVAALAYFYFQFNHQGKATTNMMLRSLISQLSSSKGPPPAILEKYASRHFQYSSWPNQSRANYENGISQPSTFHLISILHGITEELGNVFLVIDGLDECEDQDCLQEIMETILGWEVEHLHIFFSSRFDRILGTMMDCRNMRIVKVTPEAVENDMNLFVHDQLIKHRDLRRWPTESRAEIQTSLVRGSQGMFPWVTTQIEVIAKCVTHRDLQRSLGSLSKSLSAAYTAVLAQVDGTHWESAIMILLWLAISTQPLSIKEAVDCLAVDFGAEDGPCFDPDLRLQAMHHILHAFPTLLTACKTARWRHGTVKEITELRLSHHTVKEYLLSDVFHAHLPRPLPFKTKEDVHEFAAKTLISYLLSLSDTLDSESLKDWPLARHAARFWPHHYIRAGSKTELTGLAMQLLASDGNTEQFKNWCRLYDPTKPLKGPNFDRRTFPDPHYAATVCGLDSLVPQLLENSTTHTVEKSDELASSNLAESSLSF